MVKTHDEYVELLKTTLISMLKKSLLKAALSRLPFLAWGPIGPVVSLVFGKVASIVVNETEVALFCLYIDFRTANQSEDFTESALKNLKAQKDGTDEEKKLAEETLINSFRNFVKLSN